MAFLSLAFSDDETSTYFFKNKETEQIRYSDKEWGEKFFVKIDVTERVLKYFKTTKEGAIIHANDIHISHGHHKIDISIADVNGKKTEKKYRLKVE